jgi:hypothetical protein
MSKIKVLNIPDGDYRLQVQPGQNITLDTGLDIGTVFITGNLTVQGETTTVNTTNLDVEDNIITINKGETGINVTGGVSGVSVDRGSGLLPAQFLYDRDAVNNTPTASSTSTGGNFVLRLSNGTPIGLKTNSIFADGPIFLQPGGAGAVKIFSTNYESYVQAANDVPNKKYVDDFVVASITGLTYPKIQRGNTSVQVYDTAPGVTANTLTATGDGTTATLTFTAQAVIPFNIGETIVVAGVTPAGYNGTYVVTNASVSTVSYLNATTGALTVAGTINLQGDSDNKVEIRIDGDDSTNQNPRITILHDQVTFRQDIINLSEIRIEESTISAPGTGGDLVLQSTGVNSVRIDDNLMIKITGANPAYDTIGLKLYANAQGSGKTGLFYVNSNNTRDEIISKNRSLLYSMIF